MAAFSNVTRVEGGRELNGLERRVDPARTALLVIDMQNDFCHERGAFGRNGAEMAHIQGIVPRLRELIAGARAAGVPLIFVRTEHDETTDSQAWLSRKQRGGGGAGSCVTGTWGCEFYGVEPAPGEAVVTKHRYSAFIGTPIERILRTLRRDSLIFTGVATNVCVESSARDALMLDYHVTLAADCCAAGSIAKHRGALENIADHFGWVVEAKEILAVWAREGRASTSA